MLYKKYMQKILRGLIIIWKAERSCNAAKPAATNFAKRYFRNEII